MNWRHAWCFILAAVLLPRVLAHGESPIYTITGVPLQPLAVNATGEIVGSASFDGTTVHAALCANGQLIDLGTLGGDHSEAVAINAGGDAAGNSTLENGSIHATLWSNGQLTDLGTLPGGTTSYATGISDAGQITGWSDTLQPGTLPPGPDHAFLYENGQMIDLGNLSVTGEFGNFSHATAINSAGQITGWSVTDSLETHAFLYSAGVMSDLGTLGGSASQGTALNDAGEVVGWSFLPNDLAAHAFVVRGGIMFDLGTVEGENNSYAVGIDGSGTILGNSSLSSGGPFLSVNGATPVSLNTFIDTFLQVLTRAIASNEQGMILADGLTDNFMENKYLLTPVADGSNHFANVSTRLRVDTADDVIIAGFIIDGVEGSSKEVLVRALGPSLTNSGIASPLADPIVELHDAAGSVLAVNDNWKDTQEAELSATQLAPANDQEAAMLQTLPPGAYTAVVRGTANATGVGLVEVYDLDETSGARLLNISSRGVALTGDDVMIGGLIITGSAPANVVVRAIGPSLGNVGLVGSLQDPILELHDANGLVTSNDNWRDTQQDELLADQLAPADDRESAIAVTLLPGNYTAIVRGQGESTGVALVEFYQLQ